MKELIKAIYADAGVRGIAIAAYAVLAITTLNGVAAVKGLLKR